MSWAILAAAIALNVSAAGADLVTTHQALERGGREANPVMASAPVRYTLKVSLTAGTSLGAVHFWRSGHKTKAILLCVVPAAVSGWAAWHNNSVNRRR